jgi:hypothetical protein
MQKNLKQIKEIKKKKKKRTNWYYNTSVVHTTATPVAPGIPQKL